MADQKTTLRLFTVGHSNRSFDEFLALLKAFKICLVADIRRYPSSRKFPHFNGPVLQELLEAEGIRYLWLESLGGRRGSIKNDQSRNAGLKSPGFRSYADHMATNEFLAAVRVLLSSAQASRTAVMCAEKFYWRCHRRLLSDYLVAQGVQVKHILEPDRVPDHKLTPFAVIGADSTVTYPMPGPEDAEQKNLFES